MKKYAIVFSILLSGCCSPGTETFGVSEHRIDEISEGPTIDRDAGTDADLAGDAGSVEDAGEVPDAAPPCPPGQELCYGWCVDPTTWTGWCEWGKGPR